jgi:hypothetical protein
MSTQKNTISFFFSGPIEAHGPSRRGQTNQLRYSSFKSGTVDQLIRWVFWIIIYLGIKFVGNSVSQEMLY